VICLEAPRGLYSMASTSIPFSLKGEITVGRERTGTITGQSHDRQMKVGSENRGRKGTPGGIPVWTNQHRANNERDGDQVVKVKKNTKKINFWFRACRYKKPAKEKDILEN